MVRALGIEEELLLVDPTTGETVPASGTVLKEFGEHGRGRAAEAPATDDLDRELFRHQLETRTDPTRAAADAFAQLVTARRTAGEAARASGLATAACGFSPLGGHRDVVSDDDRYRDMVGRYGEVARDAGTCGMHVHVEIESDELGVAVIDRIAPWLPVLLAASANSPYADGRDTAYASWRAQAWGHWPTAGPTGPFGSLAGYREVSAALLDSGAARDEAMLYFDARLSTGQPTVEVRVCDVCTDPVDAVTIAVLVRGLVETAARAEERGDPRPEGWRAELLRAAQWRASRFGLADRLLHPTDGTLRPARAVTEALAGAVRPALEEAGDLERARRGLDRVLAEGGAARQRAAHARTGTVAGVVADLVERTEASWDAQDLA